MKTSNLNKNRIFKGIIGLAFLIIAFLFSGCFNSTSAKDKSAQTEENNISTPPDSYSNSQIENQESDLKKGNVTEKITTEENSSENIINTTDSKKDNTTAAVAIEVKTNKVNQNKEQQAINQTEEIKSKSNVTPNKKSAIVKNTTDTNTNKVDQNKEQQAINQTEEIKSKSNVTPNKKSAIAKNTTDTNTNKVDQNKEQQAINQTEEIKSKSNPTPNKKSVIAKKTPETINKPVRFLSKSETQLILEQIPIEYVVDVTFPLKNKECEFLANEILGLLDYRHYKKISRSCYSQISPDLKENIKINLDNENKIAEIIVYQQK